MLHRFLAFLVSIAFAIPFFVVGIVATGMLVAVVFGIGPHDKSWAAIGLFTLLMPVAVLAFGLVGYALLLVLLRATNLDRWYEKHAPAGKSSWIDTPYNWVRSAVDRVIPGATHEG